MKTIKISLVLVALCLYAVFTASAAFASVSDDQVTSQKIKEADGTSGQDTNSGSGVKTGHIQDGAVTDAKISGVISGSKLGVHTHAEYQKRFNHVIVVSADGKGDFTDPVTAMNSITDNSATNTYLIKVMPGVYVIDALLSMKDYVALAGSGRDVTKITRPSNVDVTVDISFATVVELSDITIEGTCGAYPGLRVVGMFWSASRFTNVDITALGAANCSSVNGIYAHTAAPKFTNTRIHVEGNPQASLAGAVVTGALTADSTFALDGSVIEVVGGSSSTGIVGNESPVNLRNSVITTTTGYALGEGTYNSVFKVYNSILSGGSGVFAAGGSTTTLVSGSELRGPVGSGGTLKLINCFDANFDPVTYP